MNRAELVSRLVSAADGVERRALLAGHAALADVSLAYALRLRFDQTEVEIPELSLKA